MCCCLFASDVSALMMIIDNNIMGEKRRGELNLSGKLLPK